MEFNNIIHIAWCWIKSVINYVVRGKTNTGFLFVHIFLHTYTCSKMLLKVSIPLSSNNRHFLVSNSTKSFKQITHSRIFIGNNCLKFHKTCFLIVFYYFYILFQCKIDMATHSNFFTLDALKSKIKNHTRLLRVTFILG